MTPPAAAAAAKAQARRKGQRAGGADRQLEAAVKYLGTELAKAR